MDWDSAPCSRVLDARRRSAGFASFSAMTSYNLEEVSDEKTDDLVLTFCSGAWESTVLTLASNGPLIPKNYAFISVVRRVSQTSVSFELNGDGL